MRDPAIGRLFLLRYRRELLLGAATGCLTSGAVLALGEGLGGLGPLLGGPWIHFHAAAILPASILAGLILALSVAWNGAKGWRSASGRVLACAVLGGVANGFLELGEASRPGGILGAFCQEGGLYSVLAFGVLSLPATWLAWGILAAAFGGRAGSCQPDGKRDQAGGSPGIKP
jgi:hypothetical protein